LEYACVQSGLIFTSNRIIRLFLSGPAAGGIEKMRSIFFQKTKSSPARAGVTKPAGSEAKATRQKECVQIHESLTDNAISPGIGRISDFRKQQCATD
jgi:hypothetical protein